MLHPFGPLLGTVGCRYLGMLRGLVLTVPWRVFAHVLCVHLKRGAVWSSFRRVERSGFRG